MMTSSLLALPVRPRPMPDELSIGYLSRVAIANGYKDIVTLCRAISSKGLTLVDALRLEAFEAHRLFGVLPRSCAAGFSTTCGIATAHFNHHFLRWCPACLQERGCFSGEWGLKLCCVCVRHRVWLMDVCPCCRERQPLSRCAFRCTACGYDLSRALTLAAGDALVDLHARLEASLETCQCAENNERVLDWLRLVKYLGPFLADPWCRRPGQAAGLHRLPEASALTEATAHLLDDWPANFSILLHRAQSCQPQATHLAQAFGPLYRVLYRDLHGKAFDPFRQAFEHHLHEHWFGLLGRRNRRLRADTVSCHPQQATRIVARDAGVGAAAVRHLAGSGSITAHTIQHASGRVTRAVSVLEGARVKRLREDSVTLRHAAAQLCIGRQRVRELIDMGLIHAWIDRRQTRAATWWLSKSDVGRLASIGELFCGTASDQGWIDLASVLKTWRVVPGEFASIVRALLANEIAVRRPLCKPSGIAGIELPIIELRHWLRSFRQSRQIWLSVDDAAKRLGLKQQVAYELVSRGMIACSVSAGCRRISCSAITDFQDTYISLAELAAAHSMGPRRMLALLTCRPVCGPAIDGARQYFYRRDDVSAPRMRRRCGDGQRK